MFVVRCLLLFVVCCLLCVVCVACGLSFVVGSCLLGLLFLVMLLVVRWCLFDVCRLSCVVVRCGLFVGRCLLFVVSGLLLVAIVRFRCL